MINTTAQSVCHSPKLLAAGSAIFKYFMGPKKNNSKKQSDGTNGVGQLVYVASTYIRVCGVQQDFGRLLSARKYFEHSAALISRFKLVLMRRNKFKLCKTK